MTERGPQMLGMGFVLAQLVLQISTIVMSFVAGATIVSGVAVSMKRSHTSLMYRRLMSVHSDFS